MIYRPYEKERLPFHVDGTGAASPVLNGHVKLHLPTGLIVAKQIKIVTNLISDGPINSRWTLNTCIAITLACTLRNINLYTNR